ncbi:hypothetical protein T484DRAFT_3628981 [Baffinella frigidus]|nr:hypothetical protein T484DRAFT_3628981 [Cryptophyta sp. CCMP2293]
MAGGGVGVPRAGEQGRTGHKKRASHHGGGEGDGSEYDLSSACASVALWEQRVAAHRMRSCLEHLVGRGAGHPLHQGAGPERGGRKQQGKLLAVAVLEQNHHQALRLLDANAEVPPKPETRNPKPETRNPKTEARNPKTETRHPKPETRNPKPEARNPKPETRHPKPETRSPKPEILTQVNGRDAHPSAFSGLGFKVEEGVR